jgi:hypothetical protein
LQRTAPRARCPCLAHVLEPIQTVEPQIDSGATLRSTKLTEVAEQALVGLGAARPMDVLNARDPPASAWTQRSQAVIATREAVAAYGAVLRDGVELGQSGVHRRTAR